MPSSKNYKRDYSKNGEGKYQGSSKQKKNRAGRNYIRRKMEREGKVSKGDGKDIHHVDGNPRNNSVVNTVVQPSSSNRSFKRNKKAGKA